MKRFLPALLLLLAPPILPAAQIRVDTLHLAAPGVDDAPLRVRVYRFGDERGHDVLYANDGQDMEAVGLEDTLRALDAEGIVLPIVVAIDMPRDRMGAYGLSDRTQARSVVADTKYGPVGARAQAYSEWIAHALVPYVDAHYRTRQSRRGRAVLGWSLGALNAFNLGWNYPELFSTVGAFSPSFWLSSERGDAAAVQRSRLAQRMVEAGPRHRTRWWIAAGEREETDDRDGDGLPDAVDDARDVALALQEREGSANLDWSAHPDRRARVAFASVAGGGHNQATWKRMLPEFLRWRYGHAPLPSPSPLARMPVAPVSALPSPSAPVAIRHEVGSHHP
jgi:enterochelin esterase-like enzyme